MAIYQINSFCRIFLAAHSHGTHGVPGSVSIQMVLNIHTTLAWRIQKCLNVLYICPMLLCLLGF